MKRQHKLGLIIGGPVLALVLVVGLAGSSGSSGREAASVNSSPSRGVVLDEFDQTPATATSMEESAQTAQVPAGVQVIGQPAVSRTDGPQADPETDPAGLASPPTARTESPAETTPPAPEAVDQPTSWRVARVIDGDTVEVMAAGQTETIRLLGLDTPETVDPRRPVECFGRQASDQAKKLLLDQSVRLESDPTQGERDGFGRLLRYIFLPDGRNYSLEMIRQGYGHEYTHNVPHKYQAEFKQAEAQARAGQKGLWSPEACPVQANEPDETSDDDSIAVKPDPLETAGDGCHPAYSPCLAIVDDLNCKDVDGPITVLRLGDDPYRLDGDNDGIGCES